MAQIKRSKQRNIKGKIFIHKKERKEKIIYKEETMKHNKYCAIEMGNYVPSVSQWV